MPEHLLTPAETRHGFESVHVGLGAVVVLSEGRRNLISREDPWWGNGTHVIEGGFWPRMRRWCAEPGGHKDGRY